MRASLTFLGLLLATLALAEPMPSPVIFPVQRLPLSFSHAQHVSLQGVGCGTCHEDAARSRRATDVNIPPEAACTPCHAIERDKPDKEVPAGAPDARCVSCHPGWNGTGHPPRIHIPAPNLKFNHELHATREIRCATCHGDMKTVGLGTRAQLPRMPLCLECHDNRQAPAACTTCHVADAGGRIRTSYPEGQLVPSGTLRGDAHTMSFRLDHASVAKNDEKYCASCHARSFCVDCHNGKQKPLDFHGNDYLSIHPVDARRATTDCGACHRQQTFCTGCHSRMGVTDDPRTTAFQKRSLETPEMPATRRFHPDGWWTTNTAGMRGANHHSFEAQRNIRACASCHREESCLECHNAINPHPAGWAQSRRCKALAARSGRMCLRCHLDVERIQCD